jgi:hypothetical protein
MGIAFEGRSLYNDTMNTVGTIAFKLHLKVDGEEVTPSNINFSEFLRFNREVADFIVGKGDTNLLAYAHPEIEKGSYVVKVALSAMLLQLVQPDYEKLQGGSALSGMDIKRLAVVDRWQKRSRKDPDYRVELLPQNMALRPVTISSETDFHDADESQWVRIERYVRGQLFEQGGKNKANIHLTLESTGQDLVIETTQDYLHRLSGVKTYDRVQVQIVAEENQATKKLRNPRLIDVVASKTYYDEGELNRAIEKGTKAWADVPNISKWVAEQRGASYA